MPMNTLIQHALACGAAALALATAPAHGRIVRRRPPGRPPPTASTSRWTSSRGTPSPTPTRSGRARIQRGEVIRLVIHGAAATGLPHLPADHAVQGRERQRQHPPATARTTAFNRSGRSRKRRAGVRPRGGRRLLSGTPQAVHLDARHLHQARRDSPARTTCASPCTSPPGLRHELRFRRPLSSTFPFTVIDGPPVAAARRT